MLSIPHVFPYQKNRARTPPKKHFKNQTLKTSKIPSKKPLKAAKTQQKPLKKPSKNPFSTTLRFASRHPASTAQRPQRARHRAAQRAGRPGDLLKRRVLEEAKRNFVEKLRKVFDCFFFGQFIVVFLNV